MKKKIGVNFLNTHPQTEAMKGLDKSHVIVDRVDLERLVNWVNDNPEIEKYILSSERLYYDAGTNNITDFNKLIR